MSIKDVAEKAGVSVSTAARVLRNPSHKCSSEDTRQRILKAAREIGYVPNESARNLRSGSTAVNDIFHIDILLTQVINTENDPFFNEILRNAEIEIRKNGCAIDNIWFNDVFSDDRKCRTADTDKIIFDLYKEKKHKSDGLIIIGKCCTKALKSIKNNVKNIVSISRNTTNYQIDEVICDGKKIALTAIDYLVKCGHRKIGYVGNCHNEKRFAGYQQAQINYSLENDLDYIFDTKPCEENGCKAMEYYINLDNPPTGIYCANDILAVGMLKYMRIHRTRFYSPSIVSSDDIAEAQYTKPMLTTVALPKDEMVHLAVMLLLDRIKGSHRTYAKIEMEGTLVIRESCQKIQQAFEPEYYI